MNVSESGGGGRRRRFITHCWPTYASWQQEIPASHCLLFLDTPGPGRRPGVCVSVYAKRSNLCASTMTPEWFIAQIAFSRSGTVSKRVLRISRLKCYHAKSFIKCTGHVLYFI